MMVCPKCGRYMTFSMTYAAGSPVVIWRCICGYDSSKERVITTNHLGKEISAIGVSECKFV